MPDDVRVGGILEARCLGQRQAQEAREDRFASPTLLEEPFAPDVAISVERATVFEPDRVNHPVAVEPVVAPRGLVGGVRSVAVVGAVQITGNLADDLEIL